MAFVANLFNRYPALPPMDAEETEELEEPREETREEKSNEYSDAVLLSLEKKKKLQSLLLCDDFLRLVLKRLFNQLFTIPFFFPQLSVTG